MNQSEESAAEHRSFSPDRLYIAVDLGAGSGRVFLCELGDEFSLEEAHRFQYPPREETDHLRWNFAEIFDNIKHGLKLAGERAKQANKSIYSLGVDSWAVDYGLLDTEGNLISNPICYRDKRTDGALEKVFEKIPRNLIYEKTGIQFLNFNTLFQIAAEGENLKNAEKLLLLPDLINYFLTGKKYAEYTNATTTQFLNAETRNWDSEILKKIEVPLQILPEIIEAGTDIGALRPELGRELNLENVRVIAPATHDTGSAVAGAPLEKDWAYISSGTWSLVGVERSTALINEAVAQENFTNEGGYGGTIRFLKNVMGLWIFEACRREWERIGIKTVYDSLLREVTEIKEFCGFIFPDDERFLNPPNMLEAIEKQLGETGQKVYKSPAVVAKIVLDSLAFRYASVLQTIENLTNERIAGVQVVGGGGRNEYLNQMTANASDKAVKAGLTEATVTGNALVQAITAGRFADLSEARKYVAANVKLKEFYPANSVEIEGARQRYAEIETGFLYNRKTAK